MITRRAVVAGLAVLPAARALAEQRFPTRPLTMIVPFPAGGPADIFGRYLAQGMSKNLGQPVVVENKSGLAGITGMDFVAKAGDAHVIGLFSASAGAIVPNLTPNMPYDPMTDLAAVIEVVRVQEVLVVNRQLGVDDLASLIGKLKAEPGKLSYGSPGGITHLAMELFKHETRTDIVRVPYPGAAAAADDVVSNQIQMSILDIPVALTHIRSGALKALAVSSDTRAALLPGVPTMRELGYPRITSDNWYGLAAPGSSVRADRERLHDAAAAALEAKELIDAYAAVGGLVVGGSAEDFQRFERKESEKWAEVIKLANVKFE